MIVPRCIGDGEADGNDAEEGRIGQDGFGLAMIGTGIEAQLVHFSGLNLFFGGVQAVLRRGQQLSGAGDPRRGGVAVSA